MVKFYNKTEDLIYPEDLTPELDNEKKLIKLPKCLQERA
jgi:hypothetical protein